MDHNQLVAFVYLTAIIVTLVFSVLTGSWRDGRYPEGIRDTATGEAVATSIPRREEQEDGDVTDDRLQKMYDKVRELERNLEETPVNQVVGMLKETENKNEAHKRLLETLRDKESDLSLSVVSALWEEIKNLNDRVSLLEDDRKSDGKDVGVTVSRGMGPPPTEDFWSIVSKSSEGTPALWWGVRNEWVHCPNWQSHYLVARYDSKESAIRAASLCPKAHPRRELVVTHFQSYGVSTNEDENEKTAPTGHVVCITHVKTGDKHYLSNNRPPFGKFTIHPDNATRFSPEECEAALNEARSCFPGAFWDVRLVSVVTPPANGGEA